MGSTINRDKVVFINLTEMDEYDGLEPNLRGGGSFVTEHGYGHEIFNFRNDNGVCYGYTPPRGRVNLQRISNEINHDAHGRYIDDATVVFTCSREGAGRVVCGIYQHARIYANSTSDNRETRRIDVAGRGVFAEYNLICYAKDALLISRIDRAKKLPHSSSGTGVGHGQKPVWYADAPGRQALKNEFLDYLAGLMSDLHTSDEFKHHLHDESRRLVASTQQNVRSKAARDECILLKGCRCNICGFDFRMAYGELGKDYIEVHHITPVGKLSTAEGYEGTSPAKDLIPLCSNCHSMIHRRREPYRPEDIAMHRCIFKNTRSDASSAIQDCAELP